MTLKKTGLDEVVIALKGGEQVSVKDDEIRVDDAVIWRRDDEDCNA